MCVSFAFPAVFFIGRLHFCDGGLRLSRGDTGHALDGCTQDFAIVGFKFRQLFAAAFIHGEIGRFVEAELRCIE